MLAHRIGRSSVASMSALSGISSSAVMGPPPPPPPTSSAASSTSQFLMTPVANPSIHSSSSGPGSLNESSALVEPLDYEEFVSQQQRLLRGGGGGQPCKNADNILVDFPPDDIEVTVLPRKIRTLGHVLPEPEPG